MQKCHASLSESDPFSCVKTTQAERGEWERGDREGDRERSVREDIDRERGEGEKRDARD